jgi:Fur family ferric uptake transcriptional regulator
VTTEDKTEVLLQRLRNEGFRITSQRETVIRIFQENKEEHLSAEDVFALLCKRNEIISLATTYRTLRMLVEMNVLRELDFAETHKHYELVDENATPHHHIICLDCNHTIEFEDEEINKLGLEIAKKYNVNVVDMQFQIFAKCPTIEHKHEHKKHRN